MISVKKNILLLFFLFLFGSTQAQEYNLNSKLINSDDGLASLYIQCTYKDQDGFLWISTSHGLNRYDGYEFDLFTKDNSELHANNNIKKIQQDDQGKLWLYYSKLTKGKSNTTKIFAADIFDIKTQKAKSLKEYFGDRLPFDETAILMTNGSNHSNRIWIATNEGALYLFEKGNFKQIIKEDGLLITNLSVTDNDEIFLTVNNELWILDLDGAIIEKTQMDAPITEIWIGDSSEAWIMTQKGYDMFNSQFFYYRKPFLEAPRPFFLKKDGKNVSVMRHNFRNGFRSKKGFWFLNTGDLQVFNPKGEWIQDIYQDEEKPGTRTFIHILESDENFWLSTVTGLLKTNIKVNPFKLIHQREGFADCRGMAEDSIGNLYFIDGSTYKYDPLTEESTQLSPFKTAHLLFLHKNSIFTSQYEDGAIGSLYNPATNQRKSYIKNGWNGVAYTAIPAQTPDTYLIGSVASITYIDLANHEVIPFTKWNGYDVLKNTPVYHIYKNEKGIWLSTEIGLFLMTESDGILKHFNKENNALPFNYIRHIHEDKDGIFVSYQWGGLIKWSSNQDFTEFDFQQYTSKDLLPNDYIYAVYGDSFGYLWLPSDNGLIRINKQRMSINNFLPKDGIPNKEFNLSAHYQSKDSTLYFGGLGGIIALKPSDFTTNETNTTPLSITQFSILKEGDGQMVDQTKFIKNDSTIVVKPTDKVLEFHFAYLDFDEPTNHRYAYKIEGFNNSWTTIDRNFLQITSLTYGDYTLKIKARNINSNWSTSPIVLPLTFLAPFYLRWSFLVPMIVVLLGLILWAIKWRVRLFKIRAEDLEKEVKKRISQIEKDKAFIAKQAEDLQLLDKAKTRFFANITHEFRTPLTLITAPLEQLLQKKATLDNTKELTGILKNANHLQALINQLLDLSKLEAGKMQLDLANGDIIAHTREIIERFMHLYNKKQQRISFINDVNHWLVDFDPSKWNKIIFNLLSNAIKFTPQNGAIQVCISKLQQGAQAIIHLEVKDTGIGIDQAYLDNIFNRFYQVDGSTTRDQEGTGIGLALVKELVTLQNGDLNVASELGKGTTFCVKIPVTIAQVSTPISPTTYRNTPLIPEVSTTAPTTASPTISHVGVLEILIIEDNTEMRTFLRDYLSEEGSQFNITEASNGEEGIELAKEMVPDLIITDLMMPKKDGYQVIKAIRNEMATSHIPIILLTAKSALENRLEGFREGVDAYLTKPFSPKELLLRVQKLIEIRQLLQLKHTQQNATPKGIITSAPVEKEDQFVTEVKHYILAHLDDLSINGDHIGKAFGFSRMQLHRKLKALTNLSTSQLIRSIRLTKGKELLLEKKMTISEIAYSVGFSSPAHFSNSFKKEFGESPSNVQ